MDVSATLEETLPVAGLEALHRELLALGARVEHLERENRALREGVDTTGRTVVAGEPDEQSPDGPVPAASVSRRRLLRRAGATALGVGALAGSAMSVVPAATALADGEAITVGAEIHDATVTTALRNWTNDVDVFWAQSAAAGTALSGFSGTGRGVLGSSTTGVGVTGSSNTSVGVSGQGHRGGAFRGSRAAINLKPDTHSTHPHTGLAGDLGVDSHGRLWYCKGGHRWTQLA